MATWNPPSFKFFKQADGELLAVDDKGVPLTCQPDLDFKEVNGVQTVVDPWGNAVDEYQLPPFSIYKNPNSSPYDPVKVVDANGDEVALAPQMLLKFEELAGETYRVTLPDGTEAVYPIYKGPTDFSVHVEWSSTRLEQGAPEYELVAVDSDGVPLPFQPRLHGDPTDPSSITAQWTDSSYAGSSFNPPQYEFPRFSVHLEYPDGALRGASSTPPVPIAIGEDGKPLVIQPSFEADPTDPSKVVAVLPSGDLYDPPPYEFPPFRVQLEYPWASYDGHTPAIPVAIAVDENGDPLAVQPRLEVDPTDHMKVTATLPDLSIERVEVQHIEKDFFVHVEASDPADAHGSVQFVATAVDANGQPLPIQPHLEVDPMDPTKVTAMFPDGTSHEPPNLYPPAGEPPEVWPPPAEETPEEDEQEETDEVPNVGGEPIVAEQDPESVGAEKDETEVEPEEGPEAGNEADAAATATDELVTSGLDSPSGEVPIEPATEADEGSGLSPTGRAESPEAEVVPGAESVDLLVEGLASGEPGTDVSDADDAAFKFFTPTGPEAEEIEPMIEIEELEIGAPAAQVEPLDEVSIPSATAVVEPVVEAAALDTPVVPLVADVEDLEVPIEEVEAIEVVTPVQPLNTGLEPIEEVEVIEMVTPVEPLNTGLEPIEVEELELEIPPGRGDLSEEEDPIDG